LAKYKLDPEFRKFFHKKRNKLSFYLRMSYGLSALGDKFAVVIEKLLLKTLSHYLIKLEIKLDKERVKPFPTKSARRSIRRKERKLYFTVRTLKWVVWNGVEKGFKQHKRILSAFVNTDFYSVPRVDNRRHLRIRKGKILSAIQASGDMKDDTLIRKNRVCG